MLRYIGKRFLLILPTIFVPLIWFFCSSGCRRAIRPA